MSIKKERILHIINNDLSGYKIEIISHTDSNLIGIIGLILNETKTSLTIGSEGQKNISKKDGHFRIFTEEISFQVQGQLLVGIPKKRSKRKHKNW
ncbi:MAG: ribonuclease P protein subunit [Candidatus Heimdallarchaeota archaeon]